MTKITKMFADFAQRHQNLQSNTQTPGKHGTQRQRLQHILPHSSEGTWTQGLEF